MLVCHRLTYNTGYRSFKLSVCCKFKGYIPSLLREGCQPALWTASWEFSNQCLCLNLMRQCRRISHCGNLAFEIFWRCGETMQSIRILWWSAGFLTATLHFTCGDICDVNESNFLWNIVDNLLLVSNPYSWICFRGFDQTKSFVDPNAAITWRDCCDNCRRRDKYRYDACKMHVGDRPELWSCCEVLTLGRLYRAR